MTDEEMAAAKVKVKDCVERFRLRWYRDMEINPKMDEDHEELVKDFCKTAYIYDYVFTENQREKVKKIVNEINQHRYDKVRKIFGKENMTNEYKEWYDEVIKGDHGEDLDDLYVIKKTHACVQEGGVFHVSSFQIT